MDSCTHVKKTTTRIFSRNSTFPVVKLVYKCLVGKHPAIGMSPLSLSLSESLSNLPMPFGPIFSQSGKLLTQQHAFKENDHFLAYQLLNSKVHVAYFTRLSIHSSCRYLSLFCYFSSHPHPIFHLLGDRPPPQTFRRNLLLPSLNQYKI